MSDQQAHQEELLALLKSILRMQGEILYLLKQEPPNDFRKYSWSSALGDPNDMIDD